jgi:uncharacterized OsmC-like protein
MTLQDVFDRTADVVSADPARARVTFAVTGVGVGTLATEVRTRRHVLMADEPASFGGNGQAANPIEIALAGLASCQVITYRYWAARLGIAVDDVAVQAEGDFDLRGLFGLEHLGPPDGPDVRPGLSDVRLVVTLTGPEPPERYEQLRAAVDAHCPVLDLLANPTPVSTRLEIAPGEGATT